MRLFLLLVGLYFVGYGFAYAQPIAASKSKGEEKKELAAEYFRREEYQKAYEIYRDLVRDFKSADNDLLLGYKLCLEKLANADELEKFYRNVLKYKPSAVNWLAEYAIDVYKRDNTKVKRGKGSNLLIEIFESVGNIGTNNNALAFIDELIVNKGSEVAVKACNYYELNGLNGYSLYLVKIKALIANKNYVDGINYLAQFYPEYIFKQAEIQQAIQSYIIFNDSLANVFESVFLKESGKERGTAYVEALVWFYIQRLDYTAAFVQVRSLDKRLGANGNRVMDLARQAFALKKYDVAIKMFEWVEANSSDESIKIVATNEKLNVMYEAVRNQVPVPTDKVVALVDNYKKNISKLDRRYNMLMRNYFELANLYGYFLREYDSAVYYCDKALSTPGVHRDFVADVKLIMGDFYLFKNEPWEATLIYSQVEKLMKGLEKANEAKLRNARLEYFNGEFDLAKEHLGVLKDATTKQISNDAIQMYVLIQDNIGLDTTYEVLSLYARAEFSLLISDYDICLKRLDSINSLYPGHEMSDEVFYLRGSLNHRIGNDTLAVGFYEKVYSEYAEDIFADDALFKSAVIYEQNLKKMDKAKWLYEKLLVDYPGSFYAGEARRRYSILNGDKYQDEYNRQFNEIIYH